ncbi:hypothetical protein BDZ89DRAFT_1021755 [Hymenopellis radicata]|nr:hypothetical protein BDZ89DRAFT_1021755 [Hymenopellis radicata]
MSTTSSQSSSSRIVSNHEPALRTLSEVRSQAASELVVRALRKGETVDGVHINVLTTSCKTDDVAFLVTLGGTIQRRLATQDHIFAAATTGTPVTRDSNFLVICASTPDFILRADILTRSKFIGRCQIFSLKDLISVPEYVEYGVQEGTMLVAAIREFGGLTYDLAAVWDVLRKSARTPIDPFHAPPWSVGIEERLALERAKLIRSTAAQAFEELRVPEVRIPTVLVDIRPAAQRAQYGEIDGAMVVERNVLEWRFDPRSSARVAIANRYDLRIIVICQEGYTSSLAAVSLQELGMLNATDVIGGFKAWKEAGLPLLLPEQIYVDERDDISSVASI